MTPNSSTDSATRDGLEEAATAAKVLVRQLNQAAWNSGNADAEDSWKRQERTAAAQDKLLNETLAAVDTLLAASRAEVERLRAAALGAIAALEREHHCTNADRIKAADALRTALSTTPKG